MLEGAVCLSGPYTIDAKQAVTKASAIMTGNDLANMYEISYGAINRNLQDVTEEQSLIQPQPCGNCLNWVLGHIVLYRGMMLKMIGGSPVLEAAQAATYQRGSKPGPDSKYLDLATLRGLLSDAHQRLIPALSAISDEELSRKVPEEFNRPPLAGPTGEALARLQFHESYHAGQIGLLRRIAGKDGAIK